MSKEASFTNLKCNSIMSDSIRTNKIFLNNSTLISDLKMAGSRIKQLYEQQHNTNAFTDNIKSTFESLIKHIKLSTYGLFTPPVFSKLLHYQHIPDDVIPLNNSVLCIDDDNNLVYKCNINNSIKLYKLQEFKQKVNINLNTFDDLVYLNLNVT